jgi:hypothetical protein
MLRLQIGGQGVRHAEGHDHEAPQERREEEAEDGGEHLRLQPDEAPGPEIAPERQRIAHRRGPGDEVALQPAGALPDPRAHGGRCLLEGGGVHKLRPVARARKAQAKLRILRHVVGVPAADLLQRAAPQEQRRAAQRHEQAEPLHPGQETRNHDAYSTVKSRAIRLWSVL